MKDYGRKFTYLNKGFTLIELIISFSLILIIISGLFSYFFFQYGTYERLYRELSSLEKLRFFTTHLEKQIGETSMIYMVNDRIYLKDLESPEYYNYYNLTGNMLYKIKTDCHLKDIGQGGKSQMVNQVDTFSLSYTENKTIRVIMVILIEGKMVRSQKDIVINGQVTVVN